MSERLKELRKSLKMNQTNFSKQIGITQTAYSMIENGINPLSNRHIKVICLAYNVNETWLRTGEGEMFISSPYEQEFVKIFSKLTTETQQHLLCIIKELLKIQNEFVNKEQKYDAE